MLNLDFEVTTNPKDCSRLNIRDTTLNYGAGYGNITKEEVVQVGFRMQFPTGEVRDFISKWVPSLGTYELDLQETPPPDTECATSMAASAYEPVVYGNTIPPFDGGGGCGCGCNYTDAGPSGRHKTFPDGEYRIRYDVYSKTGIPDSICTYRIETKVCEGDHVYALKNGGWWDITDQGTVTEGKFVFTKENTTDEYTSYRVLDSSNKFIKEGPAKRTCSQQLSTTHSSVTPVQLRSVTKRFFLSCGIENRLGNMALLFTVGPDTGCDLNARGIKKDDVQAQLLKAFYKLDALRGLVIKKDALVDSDPACVGAALMEINAYLSTVERVHPAYA